MRTYTALQLLWALLRHPTYQVLLCDDADYPGTNWTDTFVIEYNHACKTTNLRGRCT